MSDPVTVRLIEQYLDQFGWRKHTSIDEAGEQEGAVLTGWVGDAGLQHGLVIDPIVERGCLIFRVPKVFMAPLDETPGDRLSGLLAMLGLLNYQLLLGRWCFDPRDGEVSFKVGIPIDDGLGFKGFVRCIGAIAMSVDNDVPTLRDLLEGRTTLAAVLARSVPT